MMLARCHFAHRANLIPNRWFAVSPTPVAQQALHMSTKCQPFSFKYGVGPTFARYDFYAPSILLLIFNRLEIFDFAYTWCYWLQQIIPQIVLE